MKLLILLLFCLLSGAGAAHAQFDGNPDLPFLTQEANVICVGRISSVKTSTSVKLDVGYRGRDGRPYLVDAQSAVATVEVENVLKGQLAQAVLQVIFYQNVHSRENPSPFTELIRGEHELLFLVNTGNKTTFNLVMPASHGKSKISMGETKTVPSPHLPPLRAVLSAIVEGLPHSNQSQREDCLQRLGSAGYILYVKPGVYTDEYGLRRRLALGEPVLTPQSLSTSLEQFIRDHILPPIMVLAQSKAPDVSVRAFITLGQLQDATAIPSLIKIADKDYQPDELGEAASIIGTYKTPDAVRPLINALSSKNSHVRQEAADALRNMADPLTIPFLLDHLDDPITSNDPFPGAQYYIVTALYTATNTPGYPGTTLFHDNLSQYIAFWKKWAAEHQDKIKALRAQFNAPAPVPAAP